MSTNTKLAEALRLAREWFRHEEAGEGPQAYDVIKAADEALAAHAAPTPPAPEAQRMERLTDGQLSALLKEARKIIRASSSRSLAKDWDRRATQALAGATTGKEPGNV